MPLGGEQVVYGLAHTYWWVNKFIYTTKLDSILKGLDVVEIHIKKICNITWSITQHFMCCIFQDKTNMKLFHPLWMR